MRRISVKWNSGWNLPFSFIRLDYYSFLANKSLACIDHMTRSQKRSLYFSSSRMPGLRGGFILLLGALLCASVQAEYRRGDLVPTSRRGQFHGVRILLSGAQVPLLLDARTDVPFSTPPDLTNARSSLPAATHTMARHSVQALPALRIVPSHGAGTPFSHKKRTTRTLTSTQHHTNPCPSPGPPPAPPPGRRPRPAARRLLRRGRLQDVPLVRPRPLPHAVAARHGAEGSGGSGRARCAGAGREPEPLRAVAHSRARVRFAQPQRYVRGIR